MTYGQSSNVAEFISNAITVPQKKANDKRALVTGSVLSQYFAYVINKRNKTKGLFLNISLIF